jgi:hypothetical protein
MNDQRKTKAQLIVELEDLRGQIADLDAEGAAQETSYEESAETHGRGSRRSTWGPHWRRREGM